MPDANRRFPTDRREARLDVRIERPWRLAAGVSVSEEIWRQNMEARSKLLGKACEVPPVAGHAVEADDLRQAWIAPPVEGEAH